MFVAVAPLLSAGTLMLMYVPVHPLGLSRDEQERTGEPADDAVAPSDVVQSYPLQPGGVLATPEVATGPSPEPHL
jgi:hypothetical protein